MIIEIRDENCLNYLYIVYNIWKKSNIKLSVNTFIIFKFNKNLS